MKTKATSFIDAINNDKKKQTKLIAVNECQNLFFPVVFSIKKYDAPVKNIQIKNNIIGKNSGTAVTIDLNKLSKVILPKSSIVLYN